MLGAGGAVVWGTTRRPPHVPEGGGERARDRSLHAVGLRHGQERPTHDPGTGCVWRWPSLLALLGAGNIAPPHGGHYLLSEESWAKVVRRPGRWASIFVLFVRTNSNAAQMRQNRVASLAARSSRQNERRLRIALRLPICRHMARIKFVVRIVRPVNIAQ